MDHLEEARMIEAIWDGEALTSTEQDHLSLCNECQGVFAALMQLRDDFEIARRSQVTPTMESRYIAAFTQARSGFKQDGAGRGMLGTLSEWVTALSLWDSRDQSLAAGVRSAGGNANRVSYRMLFGTDTTEVELMVEDHDGLRRIVGELMSDTADGAGEEKSGLALIELMASEDARVALETESDDNGRFELENVPPGNYTLVITPRYSQGVVIKPLDLT